ncbi:Phytoene dehydrogenase-related protein [Paenibacillus sp. UNCCL117]|uniref:phytoene desaturase family protein n=1 Tax=unclassified Paenibacillus TaxID=185978 RepID=UPI00088992A0|nr:MULTISPECIES: FAD-dependent oxidoreductase [unclassified Paenibacillus]SDD12949.1 Phytoene dehydrogenase-related protein [Paenibacillus sp. cl123]SFW33889.1 Phytoene dehydrogenase-related protein [Paenibacillus sp. UNCCL117]
MNRKRIYDTAVIGGGIAGLLGATELARSGKSVVLLEKSSQLGGRGASRLTGGAMLNLGGHAIFRSGEAYGMLQELGIRLEGGTPPTGGLAIWQNRAVLLPAAPLSLLASPLLSASGKLGLARLMTGLGKLDDAAIGPVSLRQWAEDGIRDPMVRHLFYSICRTSTYINDPDRQLAGPALRQVRRSLKGGVLYLHGGWQTIVDQLRALAVQAGVELRTGFSAKSVVRGTDGSLCGVRSADGKTVETRAVLSTLGPADTASLLPPGASSELARWSREARPVKAACLDVALRRLTKPRQHFALGIDQPVFYSHHSRVAKLSDNGLSVLHLIKYTGPEEEADPQADERLLEHTLTLLQPGWQQETAVRRFLPSITVVHDYMHTGRSGSLPGPAVPDMRGLYVAGDWASHGEYLLDAAAASARRAARQILKDLAGDRPLAHNLPRLAE